MIDWHDASTWTVLIVDDEPDNLEVIAETLEYKGALVKTAQNGAEGLDLLKDFRPDMILLDLSMPRMNGWEMRVHIRALPELQHIPVIALTAHAMAGDKERTLAAGFDGYLTKPINIATLVHDIHRSLRPEMRFEEKT